MRTLSRSVSTFSARAVLGLSSLLAPSCAPPDDAEPDTDDPEELADVLPPPAACPDSIQASPIADRGSWRSSNGPLNWILNGGLPWNEAVSMCGYQFPTPSVKFEMDAPYDTPSCLVGKDWSFLCASIESCSADGQHCVVSNSTVLDCPELRAGTPTRFSKDGQSFPWPKDTFGAFPFDETTFSLWSVTMSGGRSGPTNTGTLTNPRLVCEYMPSVGAGYAVLVPN